LEDILGEMKLSGEKTLQKKSNFSNQEEKLLDKERNDR